MFLQRFSFVCMVILGLSFVFMSILGIPFVSMGVLDLPCFSEHPTFLSLVVMAVQDIFVCRRNAEHFCFVVCICKLRQLPVCFCINENDLLITYHFKSKACVILFFITICNYSDE